MRSSLVRKGAVALAVVVLAAAAVTVTLPWLASTRLVQDRISLELSLWSGYRVSLGEAPIIDVWPTFQARLNNVSFREWSNPDAPPVLEADRLDVTLSALAALRGNVNISAASMHRPLLRLTVRGSVIDLPASPGGGRMTRAINATRTIIADNPTALDLSLLPSDDFGTVEFSEGRIALINGDTSEGITSLNGRVVWPSLNRPGRLTATGIWRGENINVEASGQPLILLAGGSTAIKASLKSSMIDLSFDGVANLYGDAHFDGQVALSSSSVRRALEWSKTDIAPGAAIGAIALESKLQGSAKRLRLDTVNLNLGGNVGKGVLDISFAETVPTISGTLAFDKLDLGSFLGAFAPIASGAGNIYEPIDTGFAKQLSLDLRLSAQTAALGYLTLGNVAASAQVKGSMIAFDISDADTLGGAVQAGLRVDTQGEHNTVEMRLVATDMDASALAKVAGAERILPQGRASVSATLKGAGTDWNTVMGNAEGTINATIGQGAITGLDLKKFTDRLKGGGFFQLSEAGDGTLPFRSLEFKAKVLGGVAHIEKGDIKLDQQMVSIVGISPYFSRALALSGHFSPLDADGQIGPDATMPFFIGGAWDAPFISPAWSIPEFE